MPQPQPFFGPQFPPGFQPQGIQPFPPVIPPVVPGRTPPPGFPPVIPGAGGRIVIDQPPVIPMGFGRPGGMQPSFPGGPDQTVPFIPPGATSPTMGPIIRYEASPASSTSSSSSRRSRRSRRRDSRSSSGSRSPTRIIVPQEPQVVHVPTQGISTIPSGPRAGSPGHPPVQPGPGQTIIVQPPIQQPIPPVGPPGTFYPPTGSMIHPGAPGIVQVVRSRSSSPSSRRRRSRSPERPPVIIQTGSRRSRSRSPRRRSRSRSRSPRREPGVTFLPSRGRSYSRSPRPEGMVVLPHSRSRSRSPIIVHGDGRVPTLPYVPPATTQPAGPIIVQPDGGRRTPPIIMGRTHSRSSRDHGVPVIIPPSAPAYPARSRSRSPHERPPVIIPSRYGDRSRSRSRSPRRRHRRDYSRDYSPDSRESRSRRRRHRRERESRSRSRSPEYYSPRRRRRRDSRERSLSPTRLQRRSPTFAEADEGDHHVVTVPTQRYRPPTVLPVDEPYAPHDADVMPGARPPGRGEPK